jgi:hypothetical protein
MQQPGKKPNAPGTGCAEGHFQSSMMFNEPLIKHAWDLDEADGILLQKNLAVCVSGQRPPCPLQTFP